MTRSASETNVTISVMCLTVKKIFFNKLDGRPGVIISVITGYKLGHVGKDIRMTKDSFYLSSDTCHLLVLRGGFPTVSAREQQRALQSYIDV